MRTTETKKANAAVVALKKTIDKKKHNMKRKLKEKL